MVQAKNQGARQSWIILDLLTCRLEIWVQRPMCSRRAIHFEFHRHFLPQLTRHVIRWRLLLFRTLRRLAQSQKGFFQGLTNRAVRLPKHKDLVLVEKVFTKAMK